MWADADELVEVWLEKEALARVIYPVIEEHAVDLMVTRGYPSLSFLHTAAEHARFSYRPLVIYYLGDLDPSGRDIPRNIERRLHEFGADFTLQLLAVTDEQVTELDLPTRPTKRSDTRSRGFRRDSVELDAIPAPTLREIVDVAITSQVDPRKLAALRKIEAEERAGLLRLADRGPL